MKQPVDPFAECDHTWEDLIEMGRADPVGRFCSKCGVWAAETDAKMVDFVPANQESAILGAMLGLDHLEDDLDG